MKLIQNKVIRNFSFLTCTNIFIQILSVLSSIRLARQLQPEGYGLFNLILMQSSIFSIIATYGLRIVIIRHIARKKEDVRKIFVISNQIRLVTSGIAIISAFFYNNQIVKGSISADLLFILFVFIVFSAIWDTIESVSFGFEKMEISGLINLLFTIIWIIQVYLIPNSYFKVQNLLYVYAINQVLRTTIYFLWLKKIILRLYEKYSHITIQDHLSLVKQSNYYFLIAVFSAMQSQVPILLLQYNSTIAQLGIFNLGFRILSPLQMVLTMLLTSLFPLLSRLAILDLGQFAKKIKNLLNILTIIGIWGCICFTLFSKEVVNLLYGDQYIASTRVILIQCWYTILYAIYCLIGTVLSSIDKQKLLSLLSIISGLIGLPFFTWGAKYGATGLALGFVTSGFVNMTYHWSIFRRELKPYITTIYSLKIFGVLIISMSCSLFLDINFKLIFKVMFFIFFTALISFYLLKVEYKKINAI